MASDRYRLEGHQENLHSRQVQIPSQFHVSEARQLILLSVPRQNSNVQHENARVANTVHVIDTTVGPTDEPESVSLDEDFMGIEKAGTGSLPGVKRSKSGTQIQQACVNRNNTGPFKKAFENFKRILPQKNSADATCKQIKNEPDAQPTRMVMESNEEV